MEQKDACCPFDLSILALYQLFKEPGASSLCMICDKKPERIAALVTSLENSQNPSQGGQK